MAYRIFVVEDHPIVREGYASIIAREPDLELCGEAEDGLAALERIQEAQPDLALIDISLPGMGGLELIKQLKSVCPDIRLLVVSGHDEDMYAERALRAGASGYLMKQEAGRIIVKAIHRVLNGQLFVNDHLRNIFLSRYLDRSNENTPSSVDLLSDRELEVFQLLGRGLTTQEIADTMHISTKTVVTHRTSIKQKLNVDSSAELTRRAVLWVDSTLI